MKKYLIVLSLCLVAVSARSAVNVFVQDTNGMVAIKYECTAGELVRSFALDVRVDTGKITAVTNFFRGESKAGAAGYGIFPASFRDHITVSSGTNANWGAVDYTPLAVVADLPGDTLPGLGSNGVTLEFGGLWDPNNPLTFPPAAGTLCALQITGAAHVSLAANASRGGVVSASPDVSISPVFAGAFVDPSVIITRIQVTGGVINIAFKGGELETAPTLAGPWTGTGNSSGSYTNPVGQASTRFYRVNHH